MLMQQWFRLRQRFYTGLWLAITTFCVTLCLHPAQSQDTATIPTTVPVELSHCLPPTPEHLAAHPYQFGLIATVNTPDAVFHYINVLATYEDTTTAWKTLIQVTPDRSSCRNLIPAEGQPVSLTQFMPLPQATQLAKAAYEDWRNRDAYEFDVFLKYLQNQPINRSHLIDAPMDNAPPRGQLEPIEATTCKLFPEAVAALKELGINHNCSVWSVQSVLLLSRG